MTPLEAAKALAAVDPVYMDRQDWLNCKGCSAESYAGALQHEPDCLWLMLPQIVAVLEATDRFIDRGGEDDREEWIALSRAMEGTP